VADLREVQPEASRLRNLQFGGSVRAWLLFGAVAVLVLALAGSGDYDPRALPFAYALRAAVVTVVLGGAAVWWWTLRQGWSWGTDLVPALLGGIAGLVLLGSLHGTPYAPGGLDGDQAFRTAAITRFADSWHNADFTFAGLPSFYAPAYFWLLGRAADLAGIDAWRMMKYGTVLAALLVPVVTYLLWRWLVPAPVAALISALPLLLQNYYEPYAWLVLFAIVPWWLAAVPGLRRPGRPPVNPLLAGLIGALLFLTYYYFFFVAALALVLYLLSERLLGQLRWRQVGRAALVLAIAAVASAFYWLPLAISMLRAEHSQSLANRWFADSHPQLPLPMLELSVTGALSLLGLGYLVWTVRREALSRGLLVLLAAGYGWYLLGAPAVIAGTPLLSFRGKPLIPAILLVAGVLALVRLARLAAERFAAADVYRLAWVLGLVLVIYAGQGFVSAVRDSPLTEAAHATALPDGTLPRYHPPDAQPPDPPAADLHRTITENLPSAEDGAAGGGAAGDGTTPGRPVLLSDRVDLMALYPYWGFLQWNAHYAHPAAEFGARVEFLQELAASGSPARFAARASDNRFEPIDAFVLRNEGDELVIRFADDAFPAGTRTAELRFGRELFGEAFVLIPAGGYTVAVRR
jgi:galactan 5-O-arabinofuranosyltransferase